MSDRSGKNLLRSFAEKISSKTQKTKRENSTDISPDNLSDSEKSVIENINEFITKNNDAINEQYFTVKACGGQNKNNDIYEPIDIDTFNRQLLRVSVAILTANFYESEILNFNVYNKNKQKIKQLKDGLQLLGDGHITQAYIFKFGDYTVLHLHAPETGSNTPCGSADSARFINTCKYLNPSCIISFGICFGTDMKALSLGDTIVAKKIYPWSIGLKINNSGWKIKGDDYILDLQKSSAVLYDRIRKAAECSPILSYGHKVELGNMLTSEAVVSNEKIKMQAIEKAYGDKIIGGEMEAYGLAKECIYYGTTACVVLKAICDWGVVKDIDKYIDNLIPPSEGSYKDRLQAFAAYRAFCFLSELFDKNVFEDTVRSTYEALLNQYRPDGAVSEEDIFSFIDAFLRNQQEPLGKLSPEKRNLVCNNIFSVIKDSLIEDPQAKMYSFTNKGLFN